MIDLGKLFSGDLSGAFDNLKTGDALGIGGAATGLAGGIISGIGAQEAGAARADAYRANAGIAGENAARTRFELNRQQEDANYQANRLYGRQIASYAGAGAAGSPLDVMQDTAEQVKREAISRFYAGEFAGQTAGQQAGFDERAARAAEQAGGTGMLSGILSGLGNLSKLALSFAAAPA